MQAGSLWLWFDTARSAERILAEESPSRFDGAQFARGECSASVSETVPSSEIFRSCG